VKVLQRAAGALETEEVFGTLKGGGKDDRRDGEKKVERGSLAKWGNQRLGTRSLRGECPTHKEKRVLECSLGGGLSICPGILLKDQKRGFSSLRGSLGFDVGSLSKKETTERPESGEQANVVSRGHQRRVWGERRWLAGALGKSLGQNGGLQNWREKEALGGVGPVKPPY